jgi:hypothetical protein
MNATVGIVRAGSTSCRSYGAWPTVSATTTIGMALLAELGLHPAEEHPFKMQSKLRALQTCRASFRRKAL